MTFFSRTERKKASMDMLSLIDIVFLLLVFFVIAASFERYSLDIELPKLDAASNATNSDIELAVTKEEEIFYNGTVVSLVELEEKLATEGGEGTSLVFNGDRNISYSCFLNIMELVTKAGISDFSVAHDAKE